MSIVCFTFPSEDMKAQSGASESANPNINLGGINPDPFLNCSDCSGSINDGSHPSEDRRWRFRPDLGNLVHLCEGTNIQNAYRFGFNTNSRASNLPFYRYTFKTFFNSNPGSGNTDEALALISDATFNSQCIGAIIQPFYDVTRSTYIGNITGGLSLMLGTNYNPNIFIDGSTNHVGIGTTEPEQPLDVAGIAQAYRLRSITTGTGPNDGYVDIGRADKFWSIKQRNANGGGTDDLRFQNSDNGTWGPVILNLKTNGKVGIGTEAPQSVLDVNTSSQSQSGFVSAFKVGNATNFMEFNHYGGGSPNFNELKFNVQEGNELQETNFKLNNTTFLTTKLGGLTKLGNITTNQLVCAPNGNVGIGTATPDALFEVAGVAQAQNVRAINASQGPNDGSVDIGRISQFWHITQRNDLINGGAANRLSFFNNSGGTWSPAALSLQTNGRVGIGTESPITTAKLHVKGSIAIEDISASDKAVLNIGLMKPHPTAQHDDAKLLCACKGVFTSLFVHNENNWVTWPDFVFDSNYTLTKLSDIEAFVKKEKHLPGVPTAKEVNEKGVDLLEMNKILLQKIEEMTLHLIRLEKEVEVLKNSK